MVSPFGGLKKSSFFLILIFSFSSSYSLTLSLYPCAAYLFNLFFLSLWNCAHPSSQAAAAAAAVGSVEAQARQQSQSELGAARKALERTHADKMRDLKKRLAVEAAGNGEEA